MNLVFDQAEALELAIDRQSSSVPVAQAGIIRRTFCLFSEFTYFIHLNYFLHLIFCHFSWTHSWVQESLASHPLGFREGNTSYSSNSLKTVFYLRICDVTIIRSLAHYLIPLSAMSCFVFVLMVQLNIITCLIKQSCYSVCDNGSLVVYSFSQLFMELCYSKSVQ